LDTKFQENTTKRDAKNIQKAEAEFELERLDELKTTTETARSEGEAVNGTHALPTD